MNQALDLNVGKILVTDDEEGVREVITQILEFSGYQVVQAASGKDCIEQLGNDSSIVAVILDVIMPEQEGIETLRIIKQNFPKLKSLMVSGGGRMQPGQYLSLAKNLGADEILAKPFEPDALTTAVERMFGLDAMAG